MHRTQNSLLSSSENSRETWKEILARETKKEMGGRWKYRVYGLKTMAPSLHIWRPRSVSSPAKCLLPRQALIILLKISTTKIYKIQNRKQKFVNRK